jgi:porin
MESDQPMRSPGLLLLLALLALPGLVHAQTPSLPASDPRDEPISTLGGPEGVAEQLRRPGQQGGWRFDWPIFDGFEDWKRQIQEDHDVSFAMYLYGLHQQATDSLADRNSDALGNIFRFIGSWTAMTDERGNSGRLEWRFESRSDMFGFQAPGSLGGAIGTAALAPGFGYSESFDLDLSVLNWTQTFAGARAGYAVGRLAFDVYLDAFPFQTFSKGFTNRAFVINPTFPTTGIGALGAVAKGFVTERFWAGAQVHDANATSGRFDLDTVREGEWLKAVEFGFTPSFGERNARRVQFTYWEKDARRKAGVSAGSGWGVSAAWRLTDSVFPFVRFGQSDGGAGVAAEDAVSAGVEISRGRGDVWSIGAGWARPSEDTFGPGLDEETVIETSYKLQISRQFTVMPGVQVIFNPATNPDKDAVWVFGLRAILSLGTATNKPCVC